MSKDKHIVALIGETRVNCRLWMDFHAEFGKEYVFIVKSDDVKGREFNEIKETGAAIRNPLYYELMYACKCRLRQ